MTPLEARLTEENAALRQEIKLLREKIDLLIRRIFGRSSEQLDDNQLMLLLQGGDDGAKKDPASSASPGALEAEIKQRGRDSKPVKARKEREARVPEHLPAVDEVIEPAEVTAAPEACRAPSRRTCGRSLGAAGWWGRCQCSRPPAPLEPRACQR